LLLADNPAPTIKTNSDGVVVTDGTGETYGGPRSAFGARIERAVHATVLTGAQFWI
jgi:adenosylcobinamide amidohydrolase